MNITLLTQCCGRVLDDPDQPVVPPHLRGAVVWVRYNSSPEEIAIGKRRTRALRAIPPGDRDFLRLYGLRNDTENRHHQLKGILRERLRLLACHFAQNLCAALAWRQRTGGDTSSLFAEPPPPRQPAA